MGFLKPLPKMGALYFLFIATIHGAATAAKDLLEVSASTAGNIMRRELASKKAPSKKSKTSLRKAIGSKTPLSKTRGSKTSSLGETTNTAVSMLANEGRRTDIKLMTNQVCPSDMIHACYIHP